MSQTRSNVCYRAASQVPPEEIQQIRQFDIGVHT